MTIVWKRVIMFYEMMQKRNVLQKMNFFLFVIGEHNE